MKEIIVKLQLDENQEVKNLDISDEDIKQDIEFGDDDLGGV